MNAAEIGRTMESIIALAVAIFSITLYFNQTLRKKYGIISERKKGWYLVLAIFSIAYAIKSVLFK